MPRRKDKARRCPKPMARQLTRLAQMRAEIDLETYVASALGIDRQEVGAVLSGRRQVETAGYLMQREKGATA